MLSPTVAALAMGGMVIALFALYGVALFFTYSLSQRTGGKHHKS